MKKKNIYILSVSIAAVLLIFSCDNIDPPYLQDTSGPVNIDSLTHVQDSLCTFGSTTPVTYRKILVEDYTGHLCGNCPYAANALYGPGGLKVLYGDTIISIGVHASPLNQFTETCPPAAYPQGASSPAYAEDFRTPAGETWLVDFGVLSNPKGIVSRKPYLGNTVLNFSAWGAAVQAIKNATPNADVGIQILNTYDSASNNVSTCVKTTFLHALSGTYKLSVLLTEDSIKAWQENYAIPNNPPLYHNDTAYIHHHVLRGAVNTPYGVQIKTGNIAANDTVRNTYNVNLSSLPSAMNTTNPVLNANRCYIIAFVFDATTKEVLQVEEAKVK